MSKTKTKRARREQKREGHRKIAAHHRKAEKAAAATAAAAAAATKTTTPSSNPMRAPPTHPPSKKQKTNKPASQPAPIQASQKHSVPFNTYDHILLVGEGDFSFTSSLVTDHGCANVTSTSYDSESAVREKYPSFSGIEEELKALTPPVPIHHGIDATKLGSYKALRCQRSDDDNEDEEGDRGEGWDIIAFMFPHTGGLSTDVNRQVRANQALLVSFFKSCLDASTPAKRLRILQAQQAQKTHARRKGPLAPLPDQQQQQEQRPFLRMGGKIIVTLFEGEPYTLWNIRDLARHSGLKVVESWKFDWSQYPAYGHVRTLGTIEGGGAWKGEDREARMYVFEKIPLVADSDEEKEMGRLSGRDKKNGGFRREKKQDNADKKRGRDESSDESD